MTVTSSTSSPSARLPRWARWYALGWIAGLGAGSFLPATASAKCDDYSLLAKSPVVTVVDGPGPVEEEQARWTALFYFAMAPDEIEIGWTLFKLEKAP